jgi:hypothetical protein
MSFTSFMALNALKGSLTSGRFGRSPQNDHQRSVFKTFFSTFIHFNFQQGQKVSKWP